jgi:hypothetical protein
MITFKSLGTWLVEKWLPGFTTALSLFILKLYLELPPEQKGSFFNFKWTYYILNAQFEFWKILLFLIVLYFIFFLGRRLTTTKRFKAEKIPKRVQYYTEDKFGSKKSTWTWEYGWNKSGKYTPTNFRASCPKCNLPLTPYSNMNKALCTNCRLNGRQVII